MITDDVAIDVCDRMINDDKIANVIEKLLSIATTTT